MKKRMRVVVFIVIVALAVCLIYSLVTKPKKTIVDKIALS